MIDTGQGDGVKNLAGWANTAFRRLEFHLGRSFDKNRDGRGHAELQELEAIDIYCNRQIAAVVVHDRHDRGESRALRNRRRGQNVQGRTVGSRDP